MTTAGIDIRQTADRIVFRVALKDDSGDKITGGTTEIRVLRLEDDGTLDVLDWTTNDFVAAGAGTPDDESTMTHQVRRDSTGADVATGIWTKVLSTLTNFVVNQIYLIQVTNAGATPETQEREIQFGGIQGDPTGSAATFLVVPAANTGRATRLPEQPYVGADANLSFSFSGDISGSTFDLVIETQAGGADIDELVGSALYDAGTDQTAVSFTVPAATHTAAITWRYAVRQDAASANKVVAHGIYQVKDAADGD